MESDLKAYHQLYASHFTLRDRRPRPERQSPPRTQPSHDPVLERPRPGTGPLGAVPWSFEAILAVHRAEVARTLGQPDGVLVLDDLQPHEPGASHARPTGVATLLYVSRRGATLLDQRLYLPCDEPGGDEPLPACVGGFPGEPREHTKTALSFAMISAFLKAATVPFQWVILGADYGLASQLLDAIYRKEKYYFAEAPRWARAWRTRPRVVLPEKKVPLREMPGRLRLAPGQPEAQRFDGLAVRLPASAWRRAKERPGDPEGAETEFAALRVVMAHDGLPGREEWLIAQRPLNNPSLNRWKFYRSNAPADTPLENLVQLTAWRPMAEAVLAACQNELHPGPCERQDWSAWHRHSALTSLAHHFLVRLRLKYGEAAPALTVSQIHRLLKVVLSRQEFDAQIALAEIAYIQEQNLAAFLSRREPAAGLVA